MTTANERRKLMTRTKRRPIQSLTACMIMGLVLFTGFAVLQAAQDDLSKAVFFVT